MLTGHNIFGFDIEILLTRAITHKLATWTKVTTTLHAAAAAAAASSFYSHLPTTSTPPPPLTSSLPPSACHVVPPQIGRLVRKRMPQLRGLGKDIYYHGLTAGRLLCDTYLSAREHLRETTYSLANLARTQVQTA